MTPSGRRRSGGVCVGSAGASKRPCQQSRAACRRHRPARVRAQGLWAAQSPNPANFRRAAVGFFDLAQKSNRLSAYAGRDDTRGIPGTTANRAASVPVMRRRNAFVPDHPETARAPRVAHLPLHGMLRGCHHLATVGCRHRRLFRRIIPAASDRDLSTSCRQVSGSPDQALVPAIHVFVLEHLQDVDARTKCGQDEATMGAAGNMPSDAAGVFSF